MDRGHLVGEEARGVDGWELDGLGRGGRRGCGGWLGEGWCLAVDLTPAIEDPASVVLLGRVALGLEGVLLGLPHLPEGVPVGNERGGDGAWPVHGFDLAFLAPHQAEAVGLGDVGRDVVDGGLNRGLGLVRIVGVDGQVRELRVSIVGTDLPGEGGLGGGPASDLTSQRVSDLDVAGAESDLVFLGCTVRVTGGEPFDGDFELGLESWGHVSWFGFEFRVGRMRGPRGWSQPAIRFRKAIS